MAYCFNPRLKTTPRAGERKRGPPSKSLKIVCRHQRVSSGSGARASCAQAGSRAACLVKRNGIITGISPWNNLRVKHSLDESCCCIMIFNLYIFDRAGTCLYYTEWYRPLSTLKDLPDEDNKLMFGLLFSLKQLMNKANPLP